MLLCSLALATKCRTTVAVAASGGANVLRVVSELGEQLQLPGVVQECMVGEGLPGQYFERTLIQVVRPQTFLYTRT